MSKWTHLVTVEGDIAASQLESLLRSEKIAYVLQDVDNSEFFRIYLGGTRARVSVLVRDRELERARELIEAFGYLPGEE